MAIWGPVTIKAWLDLGIRTGEILKNLTNFFGQGGRIHLGTTVLVFFFRQTRHAESYKM